jgi:hypothetical protein
MQPPVIAIANAIGASSGRGGRGGLRQPKSRPGGPAAGLTGFSLPFAEPNARASAAVFINEHNARGF